MMLRVVAASLLLVVLAGCTDPPRRADEAPPDRVTTPPGFVGLPIPNGTARLLPYESFEPTIGITSGGSMFMTAFQFAFPERLFFRLVARSDDQGQTWADATPAVGPVAFPPQSNDPFILVDTTTDRVYSFDLQGTTCNTLSWSDDLGATWTSQPAACGPPPGGQDHQSLIAATPRSLTTIGYPNLLHQCVNRVGDTACAVSPDGGLTWGPLRPLVFAGADPSAADTNTTEPPFGATSGASEAVCGGLTGHLAADSEGRVFLPKGHCGIPMVAWTEDDGLTWTPVVIDTTRPLARFVVESPTGGEAARVTGEHEVALAVDESDQLYAFWVAADGKPYLAASADHARSWSAPVRLGPPELTVATFPTIAAGADGRVAAVYYGTTSTTPASQMGPADTWTAYLTVVINATTTLEQYTVTLHDPTDPVARGVCAGSRCGTNHPDGIAEVGDFIDVVIDAAGRPWAALVDVCMDACSTEEAYSPTSRGFVGTLDAGPALRGPWAPLAPLLAAP